MWELGGLTSSSSSSSRLVLMGGPDIKKGVVPGGEIVYPRIEVSLKWPDEAPELDLISRHVAAVAASNSEKTALAEAFKDVFENPQEVVASQMKSGVEVKGKEQWTTRIEVGGVRLAVDHDSANNIRVVDITVGDLWAGTAVFDEGVVHLTRPKFRDWERGKWASRQLSLPEYRLSEYLRKAAFESNFKQLLTLLQKAERGQLGEEERETLSSLLSHLIANTARLVILGDNGREVQLTRLETKGDITYQRFWPERGVFRRWKDRKQVPPRLRELLTAVGQSLDSRKGLEKLLPYAEQVANSILEMHLPEAKEALMEFLGIQSEEELPSELKRQLAVMMAKDPLLRSRPEACVAGGRFITGELQKGKKILYYTRRGVKKVKDGALKEIGDYSHLRVTTSGRGWEEFIRFLDSEKGETRVFVRSYSPNDESKNEVKFIRLDQSGNILEEDVDLESYYKRLRELESRTSRP